MCHSEELELLLFDHIAESDEDAFRQLFNLYKPLFSFVIFKITNNSSSISDLLQETFLRIWLSRETLKGIQRPRAWALQIVYHVSFNWVRHQKIAAQAGHYIMGLTRTSCNEVEDAVFFNETTVLLQKAVNTLPPQTQKIYRLNREHNFKIAEIAELLRLSNQTVKNVLVTAQKAIRNFLIHEGLQK
ncbi:MAG: sigma-70 family RNA polymerase sigma factor [Niabella sp.]